MFFCLKMLLCLLEKHIAKLECIFHSVKQIYIKKKPLIRRE